MSPEIALAHSLMLPYMPGGTSLTISTHFNNKCSSNVLMRLVYTSTRSERCIAIVAKGDSLPETAEACLFYIRQLVLDQKALNWEFHRRYLYDRNAKRQAFLAGDTAITVIDKGAQKDYMSFEQQHLVRGD